MFAGKDGRSRRIQNEIERQSGYMAVTVVGRAADALRAGSGDDFIADPRNICRNYSWPAEE